MIESAGNLAWKTFNRIAAALVMICAIFVETGHASDNKLIIAHRGASAYLPEHTLAAKAMAHAMGADYIEQDVVLTSDGIAVILHDIYLDTVSDVAKRFPARRRDDGRYYAIDFTLQEIKTLKVHERTRRGSNNAVFPNRFPVAKSSFQVPTLVEEIELIQGLNRSTGRNVGIFPEIKAPQFHRDNGHDLSRIVIEILARYGYASKDDRAILQCFDWQETRRVRNELGFEGNLIQLLGENNWGVAPNTDFDKLKSLEGLKEVATIADGIGPWINQIVSPSQTGTETQITNLIKNAKSAGLSVYPYTARADSLPKWARDFPHLLETVLYRAGADGIFTDFPDKAADFVNKRQ
jgi:glycerophosphoryl diester phosphodiesterase